MLRKSNLSFVKENSGWKETKLKNIVCHELYVWFSNSKGTKMAVVIEEDGFFRFNGREYDTLANAKESAYRNTRTVIMGILKIHSAYFNKN